MNVLDFVMNVLDYETTRFCHERTRFALKFVVHKNCRTGVEVSQFCGSTVSFAIEVPDMKVPSILV